MFFGTGIPQVSIVWVYQPKVQGMMQLTMLSEIPPPVILALEVGIKPCFKSYMVFYVF